MQIFHGNRERLFNYSSFSFEDFRSCAHDAIKDFIMNSSGTSNRMRLRFGFSVYPDRRISFLQHFSANDLIFNNIEDLVKIFTSQYLISLPRCLFPSTRQPIFHRKKGLSVIGMLKDLRYNRRLCFLLIFFLSRKEGLVQ